MRYNRDSSFGSSDEEEDYNWDKFIYEEGGLAAPPEAFCQPKDVPANNFRKGHIIMAKDPKVKLDGAFVAQIEKVYKCFVRIRLVELDRNRYWAMCDSDLLYSFCETQLRRHPDNSKTDKAWEKWLTKFMETHSNQIAPPTLMQPLNRQYYPARCIFQRGMVLAFMDNNTFTGKFSPAIVTDVKNHDQVTLRLADHGSRTDITIRFNDRRLFSIDFTKQAGVPVRCLKTKKGPKTPKILMPPKVAGREKKELKPKKKIGRPKGSKSKKTTKALDRITTPSWSNSDCPADVTCDISFHPQRASTPVDLDTTCFNTTYNHTTMNNTSMHSLFDGGNNMNFNTTYHNTTPPYTIYNNTSIHNNSMRNLLDAGNNMDCDTSYKNNTPPYFFNPTTNTCKTTCPTPPTLFSSLPEEKLNRTIPGMVNLAPSIFMSNVSTSGQNVETNRKALEGLSITPPLGVFRPPVEVPSHRTGLDTFLVGFPDLQECWLQAASSTLVTSEDPSPVAIALHNCYFKSPCMAVLNNNAFAGPYLRAEILGQEIVGLPAVNYRMQFYNIIVALARSTAAPVAVLDIMCPDSIIVLDNFTVYVESNNVIHSKKVPRPNNLDSASEWLKYFFKRLHADDDLITLRKVE